MTHHKVNANYEAYVKVDGDARNLKEGDKLGYGARGPNYSVTYLGVVDATHLLVQANGAEPETMAIERFFGTFIRAKRVAGTIDLTPTWAGVLPILLYALEAGTDEGKKLAKGELTNMAKLADLYNASLRK